ncbi:prolipoprotein diacylglyceryl transferase [Leucobacter allii]|uniref:Phosphatidylglycerol--prolipoprotein diacylglyceryl transferase n=1 Tax=Leucobacter allii TaxID=2932247 RepID=A0ABY4FQ53_9MICO|nr:prolipoprotein diacylglyceryl transferase [Leucobacter allii]UOQ58392.1 prolipoprotein diacylglyceryl transferase [Leucobacter allii]UOR02971.1 prolipoprotein diacylglyceryl transferase [Leucobacter allii]
MILPLSIPSPEMQYLEIGPLRIYFYALCIIVGIILAGVWTARRIGRRGGERGAVFDFLVWALVLGIVGARLYHVVTHWGDYFGEGKNPLEVFAFWNGGIAIFGSLIGGAIGVLIASRITGIRFWSFADALVPGMLLAQAVGRLGNWFNHELFGGPTTLPWGLEIESSNAAFPIGLPEGTLFHPTFLYEAVWNLLGIVVLLAIERKWRPRWGTFFALYLIWYGIGRSVTESLRVDPSLLFLGIRTNVLAALLAIVAGIVILVVQRRRHVGRELSVYLPGRRNPADSVLVDTADPEAYYHVLDHGDAATPVAEAEDGAAEPVPAATDESARTN